MRRGWIRAVAAAGAAAVVCAAAATAPGQYHQEAYEKLPPCNPADPAALVLHAPESLPTGFRTGFFLHKSGREDVSTGPGFGPVTVEAAEPGSLRYGYVDPDHEKRDEMYNRWPVRFHWGDAASARIRIRYWEGSEKGGNCARELVAVVRHARIADPKLSIERGRITGREQRRNGTVGIRYRIPVTGRLSRKAKRPVVLWLYEGLMARVRKRVQPKDGRFSTAIIFWNDGFGVGPLRVRAAYPGDVPERWPCHDYATSSDDCTKPLTFPRP